jgi:hypothetical protein
MKAPGRGSSLTDPRNNVQNGGPRRAVAALVPKPRQPLLNLKASACLTCQGGNPCPRRKRERGQGGVADRVPKPGGAYRRLPSCGPVAFLRHHAPGCFRHRRAPRSCPSSPKPAHRREQSFVNLKPLACSACQGGNPCPRQKGRRGREPRTGRNGVQALVEWFERRRGHRGAGSGAEGEGVAGTRRNGAPSSSGSTSENRA